MKRGAGAKDAAHLAWTAGNDRLDSLPSTRAIYDFGILFGPALFNQDYKKVVMMWWG